MKKLYATLLAGLLSAGAFDASAYQVTVEVDNPAAVTGSVNGKPVTFTDGVAVVDYTEYTYLDLETVTPYVFDSLMQNYGDDEWYSGYLDSPTYYSISMSEYSDGYIYKFTTANIDEMRTASVTLNVDEPSAIKLQLSWSNEIIVPTEKVTTVKYVPGKETPMYIASVSGNPLYKVTLNGEDVTGSSGSYALYGINDGDVIDVTVNYPDIKSKLQFNLSDQCKEGFITGVYVNGTAITDWVDTTVQEGSQVRVEFNSGDYTITKFNLNGTSIAYYGTYYSPYTFTMSGDAIFDIEAKPMSATKMTVIVDNPANVILYSGYSYTDLDNVIALVPGTNSIEVPARVTSLHVRATPEALISYVSQDGQQLSADYTGGYLLSVRDGSEIEIETELITRDDTLVFYFDSPEKANDSANGFYGYNFRAYDSRMEYTLNAGYNLIKFGKVDGELVFSVNNGYTYNVFLFVNGKTPDMNSDYMSYYFTPADGDVLKCFVGDEPNSYELSFTVDPELATPGVVVDLITPMASLEPTHVLQGTAVTITPAEGDKYGKVTVGEEEVAAVDGKYEFTVNADSHVNITADSSSSIIDIEGANAEAGAVYNLQGIRVNSENLPAGIYIIGGKKTIVKK